MDIEQSVVMKEEQDSHSCPKTSPVEAPVCEQG